MLASARPFEEVQATVARWIEGKVVVGHQLWNDFQVKMLREQESPLIAGAPQVLGLSHPTIDTRDVSLFLPFRVALRRPNEILGLQTLMWLLMRRRVQETIVDPVRYPCVSWTLPLTICIDIARKRPRLRRPVPKPRNRLGRYVHMSHGRSAG